MGPFLRGKPRMPTGIEEDAKEKMPSGSEAVRPNVICGIGDNESDADSEREESQDSKGLKRKP